MRRSECHSRRTSRRPTGAGERKVRGHGWGHRARRVVDDRVLRRARRRRAGRGRVRLRRDAERDAPRAVAARVAPRTVADRVAVRSGHAGSVERDRRRPRTRSRVGVVADVTGARAGFRSNWEAMQAFAAYCNAQGGIAGRRLDVRLFDTNVFRHRQAITDACTSVFAIVGSAAAFDGDGASVETDCGIPDVPALVAEPAHERVPTVVAPLPNPQQLYLVGPAPLLRPHRARRRPTRRDGVPERRRHRDPRRPAGGGRAGGRLPVPDHRPGPGPHRAPDDYDRIAQRIVRRHAPATSRCRARSPTWSGVQTALAARNYRPEDRGRRAAVLRPALPATRGCRRRGHLRASRRRRRSTTSASVPELGALRRLVAAHRPGRRADRARACAAGRPDSCSPRPPGARRAHLDRTTLLARLRAVHAWDGNGIQVPADPGAGRTSTCFAYVRVEGGGFQRAYPDRGFACPRDGWLRLRRDFTHL